MSVPAQLILDDTSRKEAMDAEDRLHDDTSEGIDWDEIIATTQADFEAGNFAFNTADYSTHEEAMTALEQWLNSIVKEALHEVAAAAARDAEGA